MSTAVLSPAGRRRWWWLLWGLLALAALAITAIAVPPYLMNESPVPDIDRITPGYYTSLVMHAVPSGIALATGPWQFVPQFRTRWPRTHRIVGRVYLIAVVVGALVAAYSSAVTKSGFALQVVFFVLIAAWLYTAYKAYSTIRRGEVQLHRIWMIRSYTLTFAAVTLRLYQTLLLTVMDQWQLEYLEVYTVAAWLALLGNIMISEYFIVQRLVTPLARRRPRQEPAPEAQEAITG